MRPVPEPLNRPLRMAVLISGGGTTLVNFLEAIAGGTLTAEISLVIAGKSGIGGIAKAERAGLRCDVIPRKEFANTADFSAAIFARCREVEVDVVVLAGFLSLITIPEDFLGRVLNIHPALIPSFCGAGFYGHHVHEEVVARGVKISGCTVHFADNQYDHGPIILQRAVPVYDTDNPDSVASRVFAAECLAYPEALELFRTGRLEICGRIVKIDPPAANDSSVASH